jgi:NADPH:quinone reductase
VRAVVLRTFGPPQSLTIEELPDPRAAVGQVVVEVEMASITFVETQVRAGRPPNPAMIPVLPAVLGNGVGGVVASLGSDVDPGLIGRRVVTSTGGSGGYAERVAVEAAGVIQIPDGLQMADAVALLADGRTAIGLIDLASIRTGETVLIEAAAGGVGSLLVQLAARAGARVIAAVGGSRKASIAAGLGANVIADYSHPGWAEGLRDEVGAVEVVLDGVGGEIGLACLGLLADGGRFVPYGMASGSFTPIPEPATATRQIQVLRSAARSPEALRALTRRALDEALAGRLRPFIGQTFPLERAADAHAAIGARATIGKTLLVVLPTRITPRFGNMGRA